jgi:hypothetical protein
MSDPSGSKTSSGAMQSILVAVVIAILAGGSAPWWWGQLFPRPQTPPQSQIQTPPPGTGSPDPAPAKPSQPPPTMGELEVGTNLNGGDFAPVGMQSNSPEECSYSCVQDDSCKAMTFVKNPSAPGGVCWLKASVPAATPNASMTSSVKIYH